MSRSSPLSNSISGWSTHGKPSFGPSRRFRISSSATRPPTNDACTAAVARKIRRPNLRRADRDSRSARNGFEDMREIIFDRPDAEARTSARPLTAAQTREESLRLLVGPVPYLRELLGIQLPLAALEVQYGGPAHREGARVADGPTGGPASHRNELYDLPAESSQAETRRQHPEQLPHPRQRDLLVVGRCYTEDHPPLVRGDRRHVRARYG